MRQIPAAVAPGRARREVTWYGRASVMDDRVLDDRTRPLALPDEALEAHTAWLARGRVGDGQLRIRATKLGPDLRGRDLSHVDFEDCDFARADLRDANLDGARFRGCTFEAADLRRASAVDARFEAVDLRRAAVADLRIGPTGFLRCCFGDFASQPVGRPDVRGPYAVVSPDLSTRGDKSRIGCAADIDLRWFSPPKDGLERRFEATTPGGLRVVVRALHMHVAWHRETGARFAREAVEQTFGQFLGDGPPRGFEDALPTDALERLGATVRRLAGSWTPPEALP